jgi:adenosylcobinamide-phosphate guanylyltransferase
MAFKIILAGGRAKRMGKEKGILKVNGIPLIERVFNACNACDAYVAVSRNTPETKSYCLSKKIPIINTPGEGYVEDVRWLFENYGEFISIACDIPFLRREDINEIESAFSKNFSLTGCVSLKRTPKGAGAVIFKGNCLVGINTVTFGEERFFEFSNELLAFNINNPFDLFLADRLARILDENGKNKIKRPSGKSVPQF